MPEFKGLSELERRFVCEYVADPKRNGTRAAIRAGYESGAENASAAVSASRLLRRDKISDAVKALEGKVRSEEGLLPRIVAVLSSIAFTDLSDVMRWDGRGNVTLIPSRELTPQAAAALAQIQDIQEETQPRLPGIDDGEDVAVKTIKRQVKLHDKLKAIELLARITGVGAAERVEFTMNGERIERALDE